MRKLAALLLLIAPLAAHAWWNDEWNFRKEITLDLSASGANIAGSPADVSVLIRLHLGNFGYFADTKPDGSDLRFIAGDDKTPLKFHLERYDVTNNLAFIWVKVPRLAGASASEKIYLYYGNPKAPSGADVGGTYDANQVLVLHFGDDGAPQDATAHANNADTFTADHNPASLIGGGASFLGDGAITVPSSASLRILPGRGATFSSWLRIDAPQTDAYVFELADDTGNGTFVLGVNGAQVFASLTSPGQASATAQSSEALTTGQWHHLAATLTANRLALFVDGTEVAATSADIPELVGTLTIGGAAAGSNFLIGEMDEVQAANVPRTLEWLQAAALSQGQEAPLVVYGGDAQKEGGGQSYMVITMKNVTVDGWVVIVILAVMFVIAMLIMIGKAVFLGRVRKANALFLKQFERLKGDPTALDKPEDDSAPGDAALDESPFVHLKEEGDEYRVSTLYRLYHHGVQEMTGRIGLKSAGSRAVTTLSPQAIAAIRATMDATQVRLTQKLQSQMVLLTIAISGGPFLGLLGTVVGVMITFAAIAASGDVNVNAIAPGIAAALAATVAGLAVAIPALFGYNWLNTKIKEINADMRVFVDEFVTRIAEHYS